MNKDNVKSRNILLLSYNIDNDELSKTHSDLFIRLKNKLDNDTGTSDRRCMPVDKDSKDVDLLSFYLNVDEKYLFGLIIRITSKDEVPSIPPDLLKRNTFKISDLKEAGGKGIKACREFHYFLLDDKHLVSDFKQSRISTLQKYVNWLLGVDDDKKGYVFTPRTKAPDRIKLSELRGIVVREPRKRKEDKDGEESGQSIKMFSLTKNVLLSLLSEVGSLDDMTCRMVMSAKLLLKFKKPKKLKEEDYSRLLGIYLKPVGNADDVSLCLKNGKTIRGSKILETKTLEMYTEDGVHIDELDLSRQMKNFIEELK